MRDVPFDLLMQGAGVSLRHRGCRLDNFEATTSAQRFVRDIVTDYARQWPQPVPGMTIGGPHRPHPAC